MTNEEIKQKIVDFFDTEQRKLSSSVPFDPEEKKLIEMVQEWTDLPKHDIEWIIQELVDAGELYRFAYGKLSRRR